MEEEEKPMTAARWSIILLLFLAAAAAGIAVGAHLWKKDLRVARVETEGNRIVTGKEIAALAAIAKNERLFDVDLSATRHRVEQNRYIKSAFVRRDAPDGIKVAVVERVPIAAIVTDRVLYVDAEGVILPAVTSDEVFDLPVVTGEIPAADCVPGNHVSSKAIREAIDILVTAQRVGEDLSHLLSEVHIDGDKDILLYTAEAGVPVVFGHGNAAMKMVTFDGFWKHVVMQRGAASVASIDLRYENQVVVRWANGLTDQADEQPTGTTAAR
jgi:cell division septal protein FtsQ